jgi:hypothetical protein
VFEADQSGVGEQDAFDQFRGHLYRFDGFPNLIIVIQSQGGKLCEQLPIDIGEPCLGLVMLGLVLVDFNSSAKSPKTSRNSSPEEVKSEHKDPNHTNLSPIKSKHDEMLNHQD